MKTTDLQPILDAVKNIEKNELINALKEHGGKYDFQKEHKVVIDIEYYDEFSGPSSATVISVQIIPNDMILLSIVGDEDFREDITNEDLYPGQLSAITAAIPEKTNTYIPG